MRSRTAAGSTLLRTMPASRSGSLASTKSVTNPESSVRVMSMPRIVPALLDEESANGEAELSLLRVPGFWVTPAWRWELKEPDVNAVAPARTLVLRIAPAT